jgi:hypothetical protein
MIPQPGIHKGVTMEQYLAMHAVNASLLHELDERCPAAALYASWLNPNPDEADEEDETVQQGVGTIAHSVLLEGSTACVAVIDPNDHAGPRGGIPKGWTNDSIKAARAEAIAAGKVPIFPGKMRKVERMVAAARAYIETLKAEEPHVWALFQPAGGDSELTMVWQERDGTLCKIRPDRISPDRRLSVNYKTTGASASPAVWFRRQALTLGYPMASAFYERGIQLTCGVDEATELWLVQEQEPPYLCSLVGLDAQAQALAARRMRGALQSWAACVASGRWPGYPTRAAYPEMPPWEIARDTAPAGIEQDGDVMGREFAIARDSVESRGSSRWPKRGSQRRHEQRRPRCGVPCRARAAGSGAAERAARALRRRRGPPLPAPIAARTPMTSIVCRTATSPSRSRRS